MREKSQSSMEREYLHFSQSDFSADDYHFGSFHSSDDAMFSDVSLLSLLTTTSTTPTTSTTSNHYNHHDYFMSSLLPHHLLPPSDFPLLDPLCSLAPPLPTSTTLGFFPNTITSVDPSTSIPIKLESFSMVDNTTDFNNYFSSPTEPLVFSHLPDLLTLDHLTPSSSSSPLFSSFHKRPRVESSSTHYNNHPRTVQKSRTVPSPLKSYPDAWSPSSSFAQSMVPCRSALARQRRQTVSDKTRCLQKLLPWDKKMTIATMLEEAYKYVKFLQAQLRTLRSMPSDSTVIPGSASAAAGGGGGDHEDFGTILSALGRLSRSQLLQVMVNSPVTQTMLYSQGCCVFSVEQMDTLKKFTSQRMMETNSLQHPKCFYPNSKLA